MTKARRKLLRYLIFLLLAYGVYHYAVVLYEFVSAKVTNEKYQKNILHLKARILTISARREYMNTEEGAQKILEQRLKELGN